MIQVKQTAMTAWIMTTMAMSIAKTPMTAGGHRIVRKIARMASTMMGMRLSIAMIFGVRKMSRERAVK
jgi:hypothetical protein